MEVNRISLMLIKHGDDNICSDRLLKIATYAVGTQ